MTYVGMTPAQFEEIVNHIGVHAAGEVVILSCAYLCGSNSEKWSEVRALGIPWQLKNWNGLSALQASYNATVMWSAATDDSAVAIPSDSAARASAVLSDVLACAEGWCGPLVALLQSKSGGGALDVRHATMVGNDKTPWLRIPLRGMKNTRGTTSRRATTRRLWASTGRAGLNSPAFSPVAGCGPGSAKPGRRMAFGPRQTCNARSGTPGRSHWGRRIAPNISKIQKVVAGNLCWSYVCWHARCIRRVCT